MEDPCGYPVLKCERDRSELTDNSMQQRTPVAALHNVLISRHETLGNRPNLELVRVSGNQIMSYSLRHSKLFKHGLPRPDLA
jgi:hypothetical protein